MRIKLLTIGLFGLVLGLSGPGLSGPALASPELWSAGPAEPHSRPAAPMQLAWEHPEEWYHRHRCFLRERRVWDRHHHVWVVESFWDCPRHRW